jgi:type VI secretion system VasD/TssJ family lipoprotein
MKAIAALGLSATLLAGCSSIRSVENGVSSTLEKIPVMKMLGVESRKSEQDRARKAEEDKAREKRLQEAANTQQEQRTRRTQVVDGGEVVLLLQAAEWVNPSSMGAPSPVRVSVFELQQLERFSSADTALLLSDPAKILGPDLRRTRDVVLAPGEDIAIKWMVRQAGYVGVVADFRILPQASIQNKQIIAFDGKTPSTWRVRLSGNAVLSVANVSMSSSPSRWLDLDPDTVPAPELDWMSSNKNRR